MGRRKIEMEMVKDSSSLQVTFSKRRTGLFKKAHELATLCAVKVALLIFSPGGKPFSFGSPDFDDVIEKFLTQDENSDEDAYDIDHNNQAGIATQNKNRRLDLLQHQIELEKKKMSDMKKDGTKSKLLKSVKKMKLNELVNVKNKSMRLQKELAGRTMEIEASTTLMHLSEKKSTAANENYESSSSSSTN